MPEHATRTEDAMSDPSTWLALDYQRVTGTCVQPLLPDGAWIGVDHDATAEVGDLVVVRWGADLVLKQLAE